MHFAEPRESERTPDGYTIPSAPHQGIFFSNFNPHGLSQLVLKTSNVTNLSLPAIKTVSSLSLLLKHFLSCPAWSTCCNLIWLLLVRFSTATERILSFFGAAFCVSKTISSAFYTLGWGAPDYLVFTLSYSIHVADCHHQSAVGSFALVNIIHGVQCLKVDTIL